MLRSLAQNAYCYQHMLQFIIAIFLLKKGWNIYDLYYVQRENDSEKNARVCTSYLERTKAGDVKLKNKKKSRPN